MPSFPHITVPIDGTAYDYFMTDDIGEINKRVAALGCRSVRSIDYRFNPSLAQSVRDKMRELGTTFSLHVSEQNRVLNYYSGSGNPYIIFLDELKDAEEEPSTDGVIQKLLSYTKNQNPKLCAHWTPLMSATIKKSIEMMKILLDAGADINEKEEHGFTALMIACALRRKELVTFLIENGADVNAKAMNGNSVLLYAIFLSTPEIVKILTDAGAKPTVSFATKVSEEKMPFHETLAFYIAQFTCNGQAKPNLIYQRTQVYKGEYALSKQTFSKIRSNKKPNYHPRKKYVFLLTIGMQLTIPQTEDLLSSAGYAFDKNSRFEMIVRKFIEDRNFNMPELEETLYRETGKTFCEYEKESGNSAEK